MGLCSQAVAAKRCVRQSINEHFDDFFKLRLFCFIQRTCPVGKSQSQRKTLRQVGGVHPPSATTGNCTPLPAPYSDSGLRHVNTCRREPWSKGNDDNDEDDNSVGGRKATAAATAALNHRIRMLQHHHHHQHFIFLHQLHRMPRRRHHPVLLRQ